MRRKILPPLLAFLLSSCTSITPTVMVEKNKYFREHQPKAMELVPVYHSWDEKIENRIVAKILNHAPSLP